MRKVDMCTWLKKKGNSLIARKNIVITGEAYGGQIEIKSGLEQGQVLITRGFQNVYDGQNCKSRSIIATTQIINYVKFPREDCLIK